MKRVLKFGALVLLVKGLICGPAGAQSTTTINGLLPATSPLGGSEVVAGWQNSKTVKITAADLGTPFSGPTPPVSPVLYQLWVNTITNPAALEQYDGAQWVTVGLLDISGHTWTPHYSDQSPNVVFAGPASGASAQAGFRALTGADLPLPGSSTLGGVKSSAATSHQFVNQIGTDGSVSKAQPAAADVSGLAPSATTDTTIAANIASGTLNAARMPAFGSGDVSCGSAGGSCTIANNAVTNAKSAQMGANSIKCNPTGSTANAQDCTASQVSTLLGSGPNWLLNRTSNQSVSSATITTVTYNSASFDSTSACVLATGICTPLVAGLYDVTCSERMAGSGPSLNSILGASYLFKNSTVVARFFEAAQVASLGAGAVGFALTNSLVRLNGTTDTVSCSGYTDSTGTTNIIGSATPDTFMAAHYVSP